MGFHLWIDGEVAWAQGTYEYRPMGAAVISTTDLFRRRDFNARRRVPALGRDRLRGSIRLDRAAQHHTEGLYFFG